MYANRNVYKKIKRRHTKVAGKPNKRILFGIFKKKFLSEKEKPWQNEKIE